MTEGIESALSGMLGGLLGGGSGGGAASPLSGNGGKVLTSLITVALSQGGLQPLLAKLGHNDTKSALTSWVGTGANEPVTGGQLENAIGSDTIAQVAQHAGVSTDEVKSHLSTLLPQVIDKLSPDGKLPDIGGLSGMLGALTGH